MTTETKSVSPSPLEANPDTRIVDLILDQLEALCQRLTTPIGTAPESTLLKMPSNPKQRRKRIKPHWRIILQPPLALI